MSTGLEFWASIWLVELVVTDEGVGAHEELSGDCDDGDFGRLAGVPTCAVFGAGAGVGPTGDETSHVEGGAYARAAAGNVVA
jgi:hypothetical protein